MKQFQDIEKWAQMQWGNANLGDKRRNKRAVKLATSLFTKPNESLPCQTNNWGDLKGAYRLLGSNDIGHKQLQESHWKNTAERIGQSENTVLLIQDTSELDYSSKKNTKNLGYIGNHGGKGLMVHSCLAVEYNKKAVDIFGLIYQRVWTRDNISHRKTETRGQRAARDNEGKLWENSLIDVSKMLSSNPKLINIGDRGSDIFTYLSYCKINHWNYVIRAKHNRSIVQNGKESKLFNCLGLSECKTKKMTTIGNELIELNIAWEQISLMVPRYIKKGSQSHDLNIWAIRCWNDERQIEWILLTNLQINNANDALEKIDWYSARWLIEEYHKCLKTGCAIEKRNLQTANGLKNILGFLGIIATQILKIKFLAKINRNELAITWMDKLSLRIICSKFRLQDASITMMKFWHSVARMGGFIGRKSDGDPGWQTLWKGWMCLSDMARTFEGLQKCG